MREIRSYSYNGIVRIVTCCAVVAIMVGLVGCSVDKTKDTASNPNGITAPAPDPEGANYICSAENGQYSLILAGTDSQTGTPSDGITILVLGGSNDLQVDAPCELRWTASNYPNRTICSTGLGTTGSYSGGVWHLYTTTGADGKAKFRVAGSYAGSISCGSGEGSASNPRKVTFIVEGVTVSTSFCNVSVADYDGTGGVNSADLNLFLTDDGCSNYYSRSDFDGDGDVDSADETILTAIITGGHSTASCGE